MTKDAEVQPSEEMTPQEKAAKTRKANADKKKTKPNRVVKTRGEAVSILMDMNHPFDLDADDISLIAMAEKIPVEPWYTIEISERDEFAPKQAFCKVNGKSWRLERGEELLVPERVVTSFRNAVSRTVTMVDTAQGKKIVQRDKREETISVLEKFPNGKPE